MKLLSAHDVKLKKKSQNDVELYEAHKAKKRLLEETSQLREFKDGIAPEKRKVINEYFAFVQQKEQQKAVILKEIDDLENIKKHLLDPIDEIKMEVMEREEKISLAEKRFQKEKGEFNEKIENFNKKLHILEEKEQDIIRKDALASKNYEKSEQKLRTILEEEQIQATIRAKLTADEDKMQKWTTELIERENAVKGKLQAIEEKEKEVKKTLKIIESKQASLQAVYKELNNK